MNINNFLYTFHPLDYNASSNLPERERAAAAVGFHLADTEQLLDTRCLQTF